MSFVATLVSNPRSAAIAPSVATIAMDTAGASRCVWLAEGVACDLHLPDAADPACVEAALREALASHPIDVVVQAAAGRRKKFLIADMDSTMIDQECIDELAAEVGLKTHVAAITARAMNGEVAFEPALRERVALLAGLPVATIGKVIDERITLAAGAVELVRTMKAHGAWTALVSGGFTLFTGPVARMLGFDEQRANLLVEQDGALAGKVADPVLGREAKAEALDEIAARLGITSDDVIAVGDGANDLDMLRRAGSGVALHAKPSVAAQARMRVDHGDLTALLYIQGFRRDQFAT